MARVWFCSDLHGDTSWQDNCLLYHTGDPTGILVVAGDIHGDGKAVKRLEAVADRWKAIVWLPGNHDWWGLALHESHKHESDIDNIHVLGVDKVVMIDGIEFVGHTMWVPIDPRDQFDWKQTMNDSKYIRGEGWRRLRAADITVEHAIGLSWINKYVKTSTHPTKVLVTHHPITTMSLDPAYEDSPSNRYYASDNDHLLEHFDLYIHGHVHCRHDYEHPSGCRVLCNPRGYRGENNKFMIEYIDV